MGYLDKIKKEQYSNKYSKQIEIIAYILRGNKQIIQHFIKASKRFVFEGHTYIVKRKAIHLKVVNGFLKPCIIYREGNPNPYLFETAKKDIYIKNYILQKDENGKEKRIQSGKIKIAKKGDIIPNTGLSDRELSDIYGEDLYEILVRIQAENKMFFMILFGFLSMAFTVVTLLCVIFGVIL